MSIQKYGTTYRKEYFKKHAAERRKYSIKWQRDHRELVLSRRRQKYKICPDKEKELATKYYWTHREERKKYSASYAKEHAEQYAAYAMERHTLKLKAMPKWVDKESIKSFYKEAKRLTLATGTKYVVDHIWPLRGKNFCGLHVPWNLQVITSTKNNSKSNKRPDRSDYGFE